MHRSGSSEISCKQILSVSRGIARRVEGPGGVGGREDVLPEKLGRGVLIHKTWRAMQTYKLWFVGGIVLFLWLFLRTILTAAVHSRCLFFLLPHEA